MTFGSLDPATIRRITGKELKAMSLREGFVKKNLHLSWTEAMLTHLAETGFDLRYGARPLQRTLEQIVVTPLAKLMAAQPGLRDQELRLDIGKDGAGCEVTVVEE